MKYVYVHGRGRHDDLTIWRQAWALRLEEAGFVPPELHSDAWVEIDYQDLLDKEFEDEPQDWPAAPGVPASAKRDYDERTAALHGSVTPPPPVSAMGVAEKALDFGLSKLARIPLPKNAAQTTVTALMRDVQRFKDSKARRRSIVRRILAGLPDGDITVVAHSLGTVATLAALPYVPTSTRVRLLVTAGSPAATETMVGVASLAGAPSGMPFPADRVDAWLNLVDPYDPITAGDGLDDTFDYVIDHRVRNSKRAEGMTSVHSIWSYLKSPMIATALRLYLDTDEADVTKAIEPDVPSGDEALVGLMSVHLADCLSISASKSRVHRRTRDFIDQRLLTASNGDAWEGSELTRRAAGVAVGRWAATQPVTVRVAALVHASQADPFAPFEPGLASEDVSDGLTRFARTLQLPERLDGDVEALRDEARAVLAGNSKLKRVLGITALSATAVAAIALGGPAAIGVFAAGGATGAAAFTSGLAAMGLAGGMAGGVAVLGGVAAGVGLLGGVVATRIGEIATDEAAFVAMLELELAHIRFLRRVGAPEATEEAAAREGRLNEEVREQLQQTQQDHGAYSSSKSDLHDVITSNLAHLDKALTWLGDTAHIDAAAAANV